MSSAAGSNLMNKISQLVSFIGISTYVFHRKNIDRLQLDLQREISFQDRVPGGVSER